MTTLDRLTEAVDRAREAMDKAKTPEEHEATTEAYFDALDTQLLYANGLGTIAPGYQRRQDGPAH